MCVGEAATARGRDNKPLCLCVVSAGACTVFLLLCPRCQCQWGHSPRCMCVWYQLLGMVCGGCGGVLAGMADARPAWGIGYELRVWKEAAAVAVVLRLEACRPWCDQPPMRIVVPDGSGCSCGGGGSGGVVRTTTSLALPFAALRAHSRSRDRRRDGGADRARDGRRSESLGGRRSTGKGAGSRSRR